MHGEASRTARVPTVVAAPRTLLAGVGYRNLRDLSAGNAVVDALAELEWPASVEVEDLSYGPMDAIFRLREARFERLVVVGTVARAGRVPGASYRRHWRDHYTPEPPELVQARVAEAVTGVISLDNLLVICAHFEALPPDVTVIEIEPEDDGWGEGFSSRIAQVVENVTAQLHAAFGVRDNGTEDVGRDDA